MFGLDTSHYSTGDWLLMAFFAFGCVWIAWFMWLMVVITIGLALEIVGLRRQADQFARWVNRVTPGL